MTTPEIRPTFELVIDTDPDALMDRLRERLPDCPGCTGVSVGRHAELFVPETQRRVWSPWLSVTARDHEGSTSVQGRFAPHPIVWTLYLFLAFALGFGLLVGVTWGYAQWATETAPCALWSVPIVLVAAIGLYGISQVGQRLGASQMVELREALHELLHSR